MLSIEPVNRSTSSAKTPGACKIVMQEDQNPVIQFVVEGLQIGQQVIVMGGPGFLRELAHGLGQCGMRPDVSLRNGRLIFLTAPGCISTLMKPDDPLQRGSLRTNAPLLRWVSDWTWAYGNAPEPTRAADYQRRVHDFTRSLGALSLCTAFNSQLDRNSMLALLADHRRCSRMPDGALQTKPLVLTAAAGRSS